jgi:hypothetical protein
VHDQRNLEDLGIPGVFIASDEFVKAADVQAESLGMEHHALYVRHPIQDRTDQEMKEIAEQAFEALVAKLLGD